MNISKKELKRYRNYLYGELYIDYLLAPSDDAIIPISGEDFQNIIEEKKNREIRDKALFDTAQNNNKGIAFEKQGDTDRAIEAYERNLDIAYPALYSYERLMVLYRKEKRYDNEIRVIEKAINDFPVKSHKIYIDKWKYRLEKAKKLNSK